MTFLTLYFAKIISHKRRRVNDKRLVKPSKVIVCFFEAFEIAHIKNTTLRIVEETVISETIRRVLYFLSWRVFQR